MILPYVYKLTHKSTNQYYIGYREANTTPSYTDLPKYKSSSKIVRELGFNNFNWEIIAEFFKGDDAYDFENELISLHIQDDLCLNRQYIKDGKKRFKTKPKLDPSTKSKISESVKLAMMRPDINAKLHNPRKSDTTNYAVSDETKSKISKALKGRVRDVNQTKRAVTQEFRDRMKNLASNISEETRLKRSLANKAAWERKRLDQE